MNSSSPAHSSLSTTAISGGGGGGSSSSNAALPIDDFHFPSDLISIQDRKDEALLVLLLWFSGVLFTNPRLVAKKVEVGGKENVLKSDLMAALNKEVKSLDEDNWKFEGPRSRIHLISRPADLPEATIRRHHVRPLVDTSKPRGKRPLPVVEDPESGIVDVHGFLVHAEFAPEVRRIFAKHEGVARGCKVEHSAIQGFLIEVLAQMVRLVATNSPSSLTVYDVEYMEKGMRDLERNGFDVSWFKPYMSKIAPLVEYTGTYAKLEALKRGLRDVEEQVSHYRKEISKYESILKAKGEKASKYLAEMDSIVATDLL